MISYPFGKPNYITKLPDLKKKGKISFKIKNAYFNKNNFYFYIIDS